ncbi:MULTISPECIES: hypothetical protein [Sphingomonas]|uniref:hypothetical protein n=1 Tax=Sphingomonas TaxID=13687 RepID=UPI000DEF72E4|nr:MULTISPECIES: hypothetical protein [Sphingomonas]
MRPADILRTLLAGVLLTLLGGCTLNPASFAPADEQRQAMAYFRTIDEARGTADPAKLTLPAGTSVPADIFRQLAVATPKVTPRMVGYWTVSGGGARRSRLVYALDDGPRSGLVTIMLVRSDDSRSDGGIFWQPLGRPLDEATRFSLAAGREAVILLLIPLAAWALSIAAIVRVWRSGLFRRRLLWTLGCLPGWMLLSIAWPSGDLGLKLLYFSLLPAGFRQIGPIPDNWLITATLPIIAIVVLLRRAPPATPAASEASA